MTCIAYERKTGLMVADSRATCGGSGRHPIGAKTKIYEIAAGRYKGALLGVSSDVPGMGEALKNGGHQACRYCQFWPLYKFGST